MAKVLGLADGGELLLERARSWLLELAGIDPAASADDPGAIPYGSKVSGDDPCPLEAAARTRAS